MRSGKSGNFFKLLAAGVLTAGLGGARADVTFLKPAADAGMRSTNPDANYGSSGTLLVGVSGSALNPPRNRSLIQFNLASVPTNATFTSATLRLIVVSTSRPAANYDLCRVLKAWGEGAQDGLPAAADECSWNARFAPGALWGAGGGQAGMDFISAPSCTAALGVSGSTNAFSSAGMVADLQLWLNRPGTNFGWLLLASGEPAGTGKQLGSREAGAASPVLELRYTVPAAAAPPNLFGVAQIGDQIRFSFSAESNRTYAIEYRDEITNGIWNVLTNLPALPAAATLHLTNVLSGAERYFRARTP